MSALLYNMRIHNIFICVILVLGCACNKITNENEGRNGISSKLIDKYLVMSNLNFSFNASTMSLHLFDEGNQWVSGAEMEALTKKYDDTHFNQRLYPGTYASFANEFAGITVTSDADFNGVKPGDNLGGLIRIVAVSPYKWLLSKGTLTYDWTSVPSDYKILLGDNADEFLRPQNHPVNKVLTTLTPEDLLLLNVNCVFLIFAEVPEVKSHNLTVSFNDGTNVISVTKAVSFE